MVTSGNRFVFSSKAFLNMVSVLAGNRQHLSAAVFLVNLLFLVNVAPWLLGGLQPHVGLTSARLGLRK